jgi:hypothetical protein
MKYRDKKNAEKTSRDATYSHHKSYGNAKAYRDHKNREIAVTTFTSFEDAARSVLEAFAARTV